MGPDAEQYSADLTYDEILNYPASLIDRWAFDQTFLRAAGSPQLASKELQIPYLFREDIPAYPSEDLLTWHWLATAPTSPAGMVAAELPMPKDKYLEYCSPSLDAFRVRYCLDLLDRFDGDKIEVCRSLQVEEWKLNRNLLPVFWADEDDSAEDWIRDCVSNSRAVENFDENKSSWVHVRDCDDLTADSARFIVESGNNYQLDLVTAVEIDVVEILAEHRGGLCLRLHDWTPEIARTLSSMPGQLVEFIDYDNYLPDEVWQWDEPIPNREEWYGELLRKLVEQGETDFRWVRNLTANQADILLQSRSDRIVLPSLKCEWEIKSNGAGSLEKFQGSKLLIFTEQQPSEDFIRSVCNWSGDLVCNWSFPVGPSYGNLSALSQADVESACEFENGVLEELNGISGSVHLDFSGQPMQQAAAVALLKRKGPTYIRTDEGYRHFFPTGSNVLFNDEPDPRFSGTIESGPTDAATSSGESADVSGGSRTSWQSLQGNLRLDLSSLDELSISIAEALSGRRDGIVFLDGLRQLDDSAADLLNKMKGTLTLRGLDSLSDHAAVKLAESECQLRLLASTRMTESSVAALRGKQADISIELDLDTRKPPAPENPVTFPRTAADLIPPDALITQDANGLEATIHLTGLETTDVLAGCGEIDAIKLIIEGLPQISEVVAEDIARFRGLDLILPDTVKISLGALSKLAEFKGQWILLSETLSRKAEVIEAIGRMLPQQTV